MIIQKLQRLAEAASEAASTSTNIQEIPELNVDSDEEDKANEEAMIKGMENLENILSSFQTQEKILDRVIDAYDRTLDQIDAEAQQINKDSLDNQTAYMAEFSLDQQLIKSIIDDGLQSQRTLNDIKKKAQNGLIVENEINKKLDASGMNDAYQKFCYEYKFYNLAILAGILDENLGGTPNISDIVEKSLTTLNDIYSNQEKLKKCIETKNEKSEDSQNAAKTKLITDEDRLKALIKGIFQGIHASNEFYIDKFLPLLQGIKSKIGNIGQKALNIDEDPCKDSKYVIYLQPLSMLGTDYDNTDYHNSNLLPEGNKSMIIGNADDAVEYVTKAAKLTGEMIKHGMESNLIYGATHRFQAVVSAQCIDTIRNYIELLKVIIEKDGEICLAAKNLKDYELQGIVQNCIKIYNLKKAIREALIKIYTILVELEKKDNVYSFVMKDKPKNSLRIHSVNTDDKNISEHVSINRGKKSTSYYLQNSSALYDRGGKWDKVESYILQDIPILFKTFIDDLNNVKAGIEDKKKKKDYDKFIDICEKYRAILMNGLVAVQSLRCNIFDRYFNGNYEPNFINIDGLLQHVLKLQICINTANCSFDKLRKSCEDDWKNTDTGTHFENLYGYLKVCSEALNDFANLDRKNKRTMTETLKRLIS